MGCGDSTGSSGSMDCGDLVGSMLGVGSGRWPGIVTGIAWHRGPHIAYFRGRNSHKSFAKWHIRGGPQIGHVDKIRAGSNISLQHPCLERPFPAEIPDDPRSTMWAGHTLPRLPKCTQMEPQVNRNTACPSNQNEIRPNRRH